MDKNNQVTGDLPETSQNSPKKRRGNYKNGKYTNEAIDKKKQAYLKRVKQAQERAEQSRKLQDIPPSFELFKNNGFGRPSLYDPDLPYKLYQYYMKPRFKEDITTTDISEGEDEGVHFVNHYAYSLNDFPTVEGFCALQGITRDTFSRWVQAYPDFSDTYEVCKSWAKHLLTQNILDGSYGAKAGEFIAVNYTDFRVPQAMNDQISGSTESLPIRQKGYDLGEIDNFCTDSIDAEYREVEKND